MASPEKAPELTHPEEGHATIPTQPTTATEEGGAPALPAQDEPQHPPSEIAPSSARLGPLHGNAPVTPSYYQQILEGGSPSLLPNICDPFTGPTAWPPSNHHTDQSLPPMGPFYNASSETTRSNQQQQALEQQNWDAFEFGFQRHQQHQQQQHATDPHHHPEQQQQHQVIPMSADPMTTQYEGHSVPHHSEVGVVMQQQELQVTRQEDHIVFMQQPAGAPHSTPFTSNALRRSHSLPPLRLAAAAAAANQPLTMEFDQQFDQAVAAMQQSNGSSSFGDLGGSNYGLSQLVTPMPSALLRHQTLPPGVYLAQSATHLPHPVQFQLLMPPKQQQQDQLQPPSQWWTNQSQQFPVNAATATVDCAPGQQQHMELVYATAAGQAVADQGASEALAEQLMPPFQSSSAADSPDGCTAGGVQGMAMPHGGFYYVNVTDQQLVGSDVGLGGMQQVVAGSPAVAPGVSPVVSPGDPGYMAAGDGPALEDTELFLVTEQRAAAAVAALNGGGGSPDSVDALPAGAR